MTDVIEPSDDPPTCACGSIETVEIHSEDQVILVCANCGDDAP